MRILAAALLCGVARASTCNRCGREASELLPPGTPVPRRVRTSTPHEQRVALGDRAPPLPTSVDWRRVNGTSFTTRVGYQLLPSPCGSCWAFAAAGALADRTKIATGGALPDFNLAPQALLDCAAPTAGSCNGGSHELAYAFAVETGLPDETCLPYKGMDYSNWGESDCADRLCRRCDRFGACAFLPRNETPRVFAAEHGNLTGVDAMKAEIATRGPIACLMYAHADEFDEYTGGVITDATRYEGITHVVVVVGWATDAATGLEAWIVRNSFGTQWGELGYYRQKVGDDIYNMESSTCAWATPDDASVRELLQRSGMA